jgi:hypothetical protein
VVRTTNELSGPHDEILLTRILSKDTHVCRPANELTTELFSIAETVQVDGDQRVSKPCLVSDETGCSEVRLEYRC